MDGRIVADDARFIVERRVDLRELGQHADEGLDEKRQQRQLRAFAVAGIELCPRGFKRGEIDLLDIGKVGDAPRRDFHFLGDLAAQADELHLGEFIGR